MKTLHKSREKVTNLFNDYSKIASMDRNRSVHGQGLKISTPKQMVQRLPIAPASTKAGNTSERLRNKIRQVIYSLYQEK